MKLHDCHPLLVRIFLRLFHVKRTVYVKEKELVITYYLHRGAAYITNIQKIQHFLEC